MKDISVPIPGFHENDQAEISVKVGGKSLQIDYRIVSLPWEEEEDRNHYKDELSLSLARISRLKNAIENYDKTWELVQIYNPSENAKSIQVLYRRRMH